MPQPRRAATLRASSIACVAERFYDLVQLGPRGRHQARQPRELGSWPGKFRRPRPVMTTAMPFSRRSVPTGGWFSYFTPSSQLLAESFGATPCAKPPAQGLSLVAGSERARRIHFGRVFGLRRGMGAFRAFLRRVSPSGDGAGTGRAAAEPAHPGAVRPGQCDSPEGDVDAAGAGPGPTKTCPTRRWMGCSRPWRRCAGRSSKTRPASTRCWRKRTSSSSRRRACTTRRGCCCAKWQSGCRRPAATRHGTAARHQTLP